MDLYNITRACKAMRMKLGYTQSQVADETGYSIQNISAFENNRNRNMDIFAWYIEHGFCYDYYCKYMESMKGVV